MSSLDNKSTGGDAFFSVETTLLAEFDQFVLDCKDFTDQFYSHQEKQPISVASKLAFWSNRKLGNRLQKLFNSLNKREEEFDSQLRSIMDESLTNVSSLSLQAAHLKSRLSSCIEFNRMEMEVLSAQMSELRKLSLDLSKGDKDTKEILHFVNEVIVQGEAQTERNLLYFSVESDPRESVGFTTRDRSLVIRRLHMIREVQGQISHAFTGVLDLYKKHQGILRICQASYNLLKEIPNDVVYNLKYEKGNFTDGCVTQECTRRCIDSPRAVLVGSQVHRDPSLTDKTNGHVVGALEKYFLQPDENLSVISKHCIPNNSLSPKSLCGKQKDREETRETSAGALTLKGTGTCGSCPSKPDGNIKECGDMAPFCNSSCHQSCAPASTEDSLMIGSSSLSCDLSCTISDADALLASEKADTDTDSTGPRMRVLDDRGRDSCSDIGSSQTMEEESCKVTLDNTCPTSSSGTSTLGGHEDLCFLSLSRPAASSAGSTDEEKENDIGYDHTQCCDCSVVDDLARDCFTRLTAMHRKAAESFGRLEVLLEIREDLININMSLRARKSF
jgi:hypothetical protein